MSLAHTGVTVLIVEDDYLIAETLRGFVEGMGHRVVGPVSSVRDALASLAGPVSIALVDINLGTGKPITALVAALHDAGIPFAFLSAYANAGSGPGLDGVPFYPKPISRATAVEAVNMLLSDARLQ